MTKEETLLAAFKECGLPMELNDDLSSNGYRGYYLLAGDRHFSFGAYVIFQADTGEVEDYHPGYDG